MVDLQLICYVAGTRKPMIISTGMASEDEINEAVTTAREAGCKDLVLLHCISSYPAPMDQANLRQLPKLAKRFGVLAGFVGPHYGHHRVHSRDRTGRLFD